MNATDARSRLIAHTEAQTTDNLIASMLRLDKMKADNAEDAQAHQIAQRAIFDVLTARFPAADARMDEIFGDESPEGIEFMCAHTYAELLMLAIDQTK